MKRETPVPVLMYHTVGIPNRESGWHHLTCPYRIFEDQMKWLRNSGFTTVSLSDLYGHVFEGRDLPRKAVVLTFDDGYVDNWIFAFPILKKYGLKGTIFICPEFVDDRDIVRKRFDEYDDNDVLDVSNTSGFLSWSEMRIAEKEGVFDIQAHAMTHTWYPVSDRIVDFRHPGDGYIWMTWNRNVEKKPFLQFDDPDLLRYGEPVYEHEKSMSSPRYFPDEDLSARLEEYVGERGGPKYFDEPGWREKLFERAEELRKSGAAGRYEARDEYEKRVFSELSESKRMIEENLDKKVDFLCWPGGSGTETGVAAAREAGFKMSTAAKDMPQRSRSRIRNVPSQRSDRIARISPILYWDGRSTVDSKIVYFSGASLVIYLMQYKRILLAQFWGAIIRKFLKGYFRIFSRTDRSRGSYSAKREER